MKCYVSVQVTYLLDREYIYRSYASNYTKKEYIYRKNKEIHRRSMECVGQTLNCLAADEILGCLSAVAVGVRDFPSRDAPTVQTFKTFLRSQPQAGLRLS